MELILQKTWRGLKRNTRLIAETRAVVPLVLKGTSPAANPVLLRPHAIPERPSQCQPVDAISFGAREGVAKHACTFAFIAWVACRANRRRGLGATGSKLVWDQCPGRDQGGGRQTWLGSTARRQGSTYL